MHHQSFCGMLLLFVLTLSLDGSLAGSTQSLALNNFSVDVFTPGMTNTDGVSYQCIRIPSIVLDEAHHTLIAFAECRHVVGDGCVPKGAKSSQGIDLCSRVSLDGGLSWGPLRSLAKNAGQPTVTFDHIRKQTVVVFNTKSGPGCSGDGCCPVKQMFSKDGGLTWSTPNTLMPTTTVAWPARVGPGTGIQLSTSNVHAPGRLINIGWHFAHALNTSFDTIFLSDDGGASWRQPAQPHQLGTPCDEAQVVELPNGDILAMMRPTVKDPKCPLCRRLSRSADGGETWGWDGKVAAWHSEPQLNGAICMGSLLRGGDHVTYASYPNNTAGMREQGTIRVSFDADGSSWHDYVSFGDAPFSYSCLTAMPQKGYIGILWETGMEGCSGPSCRSVFSTFAAASRNSYEVFV